MSPVRERRQAALAALKRFQAKHDLPARPIRSERRPDCVIALVGTALDGREYGIGYSARR